jgi:hypothetical protein
MSSTPNHFAQGFILSMLLGMGWVWGVIAGIMSAAMDYDVWKDSIKLALELRKQGEKDWWKGRDWQLYSRSHTWRWIYLLLPPVALHYVIDKLTHKWDGGWVWWAYWLEVILWILCILWVIL